METAAFSLRRRMAGGWGGRNGERERERENLLPSLRRALMRDNSHELT
jgi:hypothetical protein